MTRRGLGEDRGSVVAEFAVALPAVALVLLLGAGSLGACARQVRLQDAAADAARIVARGESEDRAGAVVSAAVSGASAATDRRGPRLRHGLLDGGSPPVILSATSCALDGGL